MKREAEKDEAVEIELDFLKSVNENAAAYFNLSKKMKKKIEGVKEAIELTRKKMGSALKKKPKTKKAERRERQWYERFRWFHSSSGFLCIGGRDSLSNELLIKKHTSPADIVFHSEMAGSPFFVVKSEGKTPDEKTLNEAAVATASFSRAWKRGISYAEVYWVAPEQVSKEAKAGEYLSRGAFMIYGKKNMMRATLELCVGVKDGVFISAPCSAVAEPLFRILPGDTKVSDAAKMIARKINYSDVDEIVRMLPPGPLSLEPVRKGVRIRKQGKN